MDSLTQAVLGGAVTYAVMGRRTGARAVLIGAVLGTIPDLDVLIDFGGPIENMTYHRGFSHSIFVQALVTPLFAWVLARPKRLNDPVFMQWCLAIYLCFVTHTLADTLTVYGTQLFWPLTDHPYAYSILFIVDPAYTVPLIIGCLGAWLLRRGDRAMRLNAAMLIVSTLYLLWSSGAKWSIDQRVAQAMALRGIQPSVYESTPAPLNTLLWRGVAVQGDRYFEIWASVFDSVDEIQIQGYPRRLDLLESVGDHPSVQRLRWFTKGQYKAWQSDAVILISDLRMGIEGAYVFNFEVGQIGANGVALGSFNQREQRPSLGGLRRIWDRIFDPRVVISEPPAVDSTTIGMQ